MTPVDRDSLPELNETRKRIAKDMPIPANYLLTGYHRLCEKQQKALDRLEGVIFGEDDPSEEWFEELESIFNELKGERADG